ncbi:CSC1-like protein ERD4 isoform X2 [Telopea speciosissima]|uniref:CSC1-like protein ERD4 isoform X2 n=1 Tax=Telopea speciosissima TaxID=54955 RepID=UPI001CC54649|nr:CSC1-like protein ERD4 isoform X2 [Telopea speciosissima]
MDLSSFVTSLATSFVIFLFLMLLFVLLSRKQGNSVVYFPNRILKGLEPWERSRSKNPFAWIREALSSTEADIISMSGVDTAVYFVFLSSVLSILVLSALVLLPVLLPVAATDYTLSKKNSTSNGTFSDFDKLSMGNIEVRSPRLWAFLIGTYWVSFVTFYILWKAYRHVSDLRATALMSPEVKPEQFAVLVRDIPQVPEGKTRKEQVDSYFRTIHSETFYRSMIVTDNKQVNKIWEELEGYRKKLAHAEAIFADSKRTGTSEGTRPASRVGFLGLAGKKVDTIDYCNEKIKELIPKLESEQKSTTREKQQAAAIVFFNSRLAAASAAQAVHAQMPDSWTVTEAPEPRQLIWSNLPIKYYGRTIRQCIVYVVVALVIFFFMIPITIISAFTTLDNLKRLLPFLKSIVDIVQIKTVLEAYLPQIALILFLAFLPKFLMMFSKAEGIPSQAHAERASSGKFFYFTVLNVFLGVTVGGTLFGTLKTIEKNPNDAIPILGNGLPANAAFFVTFVALKFFIGYGLELFRLVPLIIFHLKRKYLCKTEAELKEAWAPGDFGYATRIPNDMLIVTIVLCYSVIAPIILLFGVVYFGLGWLILRNQALKVYVPSYESYGRMWPHMHSRILAALIIYQITMFGFFGIKEFVATVLLIPLPIFSFFFSYVCSKKYYRSFSSTPLEVACQELKEIPNMESIYRAFIPACLRSEKFDDGDQFEDALAQLSRTGSTI